MIESWFSQDIAPYFSFLSLLSLFALLKIWAQKGRHRAAVTSIWVGIIVFGIGLLVASALARTLGQPPHVVRALALSGGLITLLFLALFGEIRKAYTEADLRKTLARDI